MSKEKPIPRDLYSRHNARTLRNNPTKEENHLWYDFLRSYPVRFHRQYVIENYIVDFFCPKAKLIIELDGSQHYTTDRAVDYDLKRTKDIENTAFLYSDIQISIYTDNFVTYARILIIMCRKGCNPPALRATSLRKGRLR